MKVVTTWTGGRAFTAVGDSGYDINMDATEAYGGLGKGATPTEMLLGALAGCIGIDVTMILRPHLDKITKIEIITDGTRKEEAPKGFTAIAVTFVIDVDINNKKVWREIRLGKEKNGPGANALKEVVNLHCLCMGKECLDVI